MSSSTSPVTPPLTPALDAFLAATREGSPREVLLRADVAYARARSSDPSPRPAAIVDIRSGPAPPGGAFDVVVAGGTLGIILALALQRRGVATAVVERGRVAGREQEWNCSRAELAALVDLGLVGAEELDACVVSEWNPSRIALQTGVGEKEEVFVRDILNCGVSPRMLIDRIREAYVEAGGTVKEFCTIGRIDVFDDACVVKTTERGLRVDAPLGAGGGGVVGDGAGKEGEVKARLVVDCMGSFSPVAAQARDYAPPDGICVTVGACVTTGVAEPEDAAASDLLATIDPIDSATGQQSFWESFPAFSPDAPRKTAYMFQYGACTPSRPSLAQVLDTYVEKLPEYLGVPRDDLAPVRVLMGYFPAWRASPLKTPFPRIFFAGDASGTQSPVSFGGFGSLLRHLPRLVPALTAALAETDVSSSDLARIAPYMPSNSVAWLFASAMSGSAKRGAGPLGEYGIGSLLAGNMLAMQGLGPEVLRPFLQDVVQAGALTRTLGSMVADDFVFALRVAQHVGPVEIAIFVRHYFALCIFAAAARAAEGAGLYEGERSFKTQRRLEQLRWGSGRDHAG